MTGKAEFMGRSIHLTRTFELETRIAFQPELEPKQIELARGEMARVQVALNRVEPYDEPISVMVTGPDGFGLPPVLTAGHAQAGVGFDVTVGDAVQPGTYELDVAGAALINGFAERAGGGKLKIVVKETE